MTAIVHRTSFQAVFAGLDGIARAGRGIHRELKKLVQDDQRDHAKQRTGPSGLWAPRALATVRRMRLEGVRRRPLGKLLGAGVSYRANRAQIVGESKIKWSGVHQEGGKVGRGATVPARPFLWLSEAMIERALAYVADVRVRGFGER
ncbi:MAG TPA: hypothetical protein VN253_30250 [Kofleriaceae bacterium]|nr:hypothetical protein [Kofleriaceae bacterium]